MKKYILIGLLVGSSLFAKGNIDKLKSTLVSIEKEKIAFSEQNIKCITAAVKRKDLKECKIKAKEFRKSLRTKMSGLRNAHKKNKGN